MNITDLPAPDPLAALDPDQREVATTFGGPVVVIAGAGTGKTRAITHRIAHGVATGRYTASRVLAVTFTTRAAGELRGRLDDLGVRGVQARTFHAAALRQARYFWPRVHGQELPPLLDNRMGVVAETAARLRVDTDPGTLRDLSGEISWAKVSNVPPDSYPGVARRDGRELASVPAETVARVMAAYEDAKQQRVAIDFEDILLCCCALLAEHEEVAAAVHGQYRHFVVDEYQDVNPLQETLLGLWLGQRDDLCVVGDPAQTIHSFAGARADHLTGFTRRHPGARVIRLNRNYRSTPEIIDLANRTLHRTSAAERAAGRPTSDLGAVRLHAVGDHGPTPTLTAAGTDADEAELVARWLRDLRERGVPYREMAVLMRTNAQSPAIEQSLADADIPYLVRGGERFYERPEVRRALVLLETQARTDSTDPVIEQVHSALVQAGWTDQAPQGSGAARERWESLAALHTAASDFIADSADVTMAGLVTELGLRASAQQVPVAEGVTISTIHSAKGLEWNAVALIGAAEGLLPFVLAQRPEDIVEERRLFHVALTRARRHLHVSWPTTRAGGGVRKRSRFLDGTAADTEPVTGTRRRRRPVTVATCRVCDGPLGNGTEQKLGRHTTCESSYDENLLAELKEWRLEVSRERRVPAYVIFTDATLVAIAEALPASETDLLRLRGIGRAKADAHAEAVLEIVSRFRA